MSYKFSKELLLKETAHRPFPLPTSPWIMQQTWSDLLFLHYKVPLETLKKFIPTQVEIDTFQDEAWVSISPFRMRNIKLRYLPPIPTTTNFLELNFRTYVKINGKKGIYFFSLDASSAAAVFGARIGANLPYLNARMSVQENEGGFHYQSRRMGKAHIPAELDVKYKPISSPFHARQGSLEEWLVERYCLFQQKRNGKIIEIDIHHIPWPLQKVEAEIITNTLPSSFNIERLHKEPIMQYVKSIDVLVWPPSKVAI